MKRFIQLLVRLSPILIPIIKRQLEKRSQQQNIKK